MQLDSLWLSWEAAPLCISPRFLRELGCLLASFTDLALLVLMKLPCFMWTEMAWIAVSGGGGELMEA